MTKPAREGRPPPLVDPPAAVVIDGGHQLGSFNAPIPRLNLADAVTATGFRGCLARLARDLRTKEWEAVQFGNDEWFGLAAVYDAKVLGMVMTIAVHQQSGRIHRWINNTAPGAVSVARGLQGTASVGRSRAGSSTMINRLERGLVRIEARHRGSAGGPALMLSGEGHSAAGGARHLAVCHPFTGERVLYTNKCLMPFHGELRIGAEVVVFADDRSFLILDDHHGEYPWPQDYDWVTGARRDPDGALFGFNLTRNQVVDADRYNENVVWVDGELHRLPAVTFARPHGVDQPWHISDRHGAVDVTFTPTVRSTRHVGPRHILAEYHAPYGWFSGRIDAGGRTVVVDGLFGMGEKKRIRV